MERHGLHAYKERLGVPFAPSRSGPAKPRGARPESHEVGGSESGYVGHDLRSAPHSCFGSATAPTTHNQTGRGHADPDGIALCI